MSLPSDAIAIVGMSGRFPGAQTVDEFWKNLAEGRDSITRFAEEETEFSMATAAARARGAKFIRARGILDGVDLFDAEFFGIQPREAEIMDPQHRIFLECAWEAIEAAGYHPGTYPGLIGVYAGLSLNSYLLYNLNQASEAAAKLAGGYPVGDFPMMLGNERDYMTTRVAYKLNLRGPSMTIQTACSTSLVAVCQACTALQTYQCDMALAGGVSVTLPQRREYLYEEDGMISPDGFCRSFDAQAAGTVFSNGSGIVLLKRLADAEADGDTVLAVIRGHALNNDGSEKVGFAAPGLNAQAAVIAMAQATAGVEPSSISYVEAHGTATPLGDPIEIAALTKAFREGGAEGKEFCAIGTAKTNVGHLDVAAGVTGLIKTVLQLQHEHIPPLLHFDSPNPRIDFSNSPFYALNQSRPWPRSSAPRRAGVSSFGVGGTNAHVVVEEAPEAETIASPRPSQLLLLSARSAAALRQMADRLADHLESHPDIDLADVSYTLAVGRRAFGFRRAVVAANAAEAARILREPEKSFVSVPENPDRVAADLIAALDSSAAPESLLGDLWVSGASPDWAVYFSAEKRRRIPLPTYPFERKRFWIEPAPRAVLENEETPNQNEKIAPAMDRGAQFVESLRRMLEELSGRNVEDTNAAFSELGFDSLFLTQVSQAVFTRFGVKVTFRQLLGEISNLARLAAHLDKTLPADAPVVVSAKASGSRLPVIRWAGEGGPALVASTRFGPYKPLQREAGELTANQRRALDDLIARYVRRTPASKNYTGDHRSHYADPRAVAGFNPLWKEMVYPIVSERSKGSTIWDIDGNDYVDVTMGFGTYFFGHSPDWLIAAVQKQLHHGIEIGPQSASAGAIARDICEFSGMERATFCNTGSEAVMAALRLARMVTGRTRVACFTGDYHGMFDEVLVRGSWVNGEYRAQPVAPGIPDSSVENILVLDYGTPETLEILRRHANELAAILVEPVQSRRPDLQPKAFVKELRAISERAGVALIFDEVVTGFRCHPGGAQAMFGVQADLATYGKVLGGGIPIGVLAGKRKFMDGLDGGTWQYGDDSRPEAGITFFAGTFVRHPLAMAAARAVIAHLREQGPGLQLRMTERTALLARTLNENFAAAGVPLHVPHFSAVAGLEYAPELTHASLLWYYLREKGIHIWEGRPMYLTSAHTDEDFDRVISAFRDSVGEMQEAGFLPQRPSGSTALDVPATFPRFDSAPITEAQSEILAAVQMGDTANRAFNESLTIDLQGVLDLSALEKSVLHIMQRHASLRSTFRPTELRQIFLPIPEAVSLPVEERRALKDLCEAATATVFDLVNGPLTVWQLARLGPDHHALIFTAHHIICDGWSTGMIVDELSKSYNAFRAGKIPMLAPPMSFADYARGLDAKKDENANDRDFWLDQFREAAPVLELQVDHVRPILKTYAGGFDSIAVPPGLFESLQTHSPTLGGTLFATLLAAFATLLNRLTGQSDLVVGVPSAGQTLAGCDELIGHCLNFLPLRVRCPENATFQSFAKDVRRVVLDSYDHQNFTFGRLVQELKIPRDPARLPLVSAVFNIDRSGFDQLKFDGLSTDVRTNPKQSVNFELFFNVVQSDAMLIVECEYNSDIFAPVTIRRWLNQYLVLLEAVCAKPEAEIVSLELLSHSEPGLLNLWSGRTTKYPRDSTIAQVFDAVATMHADRPALVQGDEVVSYRELRHRACSLARELGPLSPGTPVGIVASGSLDVIVGILGILMAGGAYLPIDPSLPDERIEFMLNEAGVTMVVTDGTFNLASRHMLAIPREAVPCDALPASNAEATDAAYVLYTSGSTGTPKGVLVPHRAVIRLVRGTDYMEFRHNEVFLQAAPLSFDASTFEIWGALLNGAKLVVLPKGSYGLDRIAYALRSHAVTTLWLTSGLFQTMVDEHLEAMTGVRNLLAGGDVLSIPHLRRAMTAMPSTRFVNGYGPTENTTFTTCHTITSDDLLRPSVPIGKPIPNSTVLILDHEKRQVPVGIEGELYTGGDGLAIGYLNDAERTASVFTNLSGLGRVYRTGDRARWRDDGSIEFLGRWDRQVKIRGVRVEPSEIEVALLTHPKVAEARAGTRGRSAAAKTLVAWVRLNGKTDRDELTDYLAAKLPTFLRPDAIVIVERFPLTSSGKIDIDSLPEPDVSARTRSAPPQTDIEKRLAVVWCEVLGGVQPGRDDSFFVLGGHSLLALKMFSRVEREFGVSLPLVALLKAPTIRKFASLIELESATAAGPSERRIPLATLNPAGSLDPLFLIHGGDGGVIFYRAMAEHLSENRPILAIESPGFREGTGYFASIEEMAAAYCAVIRSRQPKGPYFLGGYSFGAIVAYEMARQLSEVGESIGGFVNIDGLSPKLMDFGRADRLKREWRRQAHVGPIGQLAGLAKYALQRLRARVAGTQRAAIDEVFDSALYGAHVELLKLYRVQPLGIEMDLLRVGEPEDGIPSDYGWRPLVRNLEIRSISGDHESLFKSCNLGSLNRAVAAALRSAESRSA